MYLGSTNNMPGDVPVWVPCHLSMRMNDAVLWLGVKNGMQICGVSACFCYKLFSVRRMLSAKSHT